MAEEVGWTACEVAVEFREEDVQRYIDEYRLHVSSSKSAAIRIRRAVSTPTSAAIRMRQAAAVIFVLATTVFATFIVGTLTENLQWTIFTFTASPFVWIPVLLWLTKIRSRARLWKDLQATPHLLRLEDDGLSLRTDTHCYTVFWKTVQDLVVSESFFMILTSAADGGCFLVPLRCFASREHAKEFLLVATERWKASLAIAGET